MASWGQQVKRLSFARVFNTHSFADGAPKDREESPENKEIQQRKVTAVASHHLEAIMWWGKARSNTIVLLIPYKRQNLSVFEKPRYPMAAQNFLISYEMPAFNIMISRSHSLNSTFCPGYLLLFPPKLSSPTFVLRAATVFVVSFLSLLEATNLH